MVIRKALIPIAGLGTRLLPVSSVVPKAMFPLVDSAGRVRSVLHAICAEAVQAGVQDVGVVVSPGQAEPCRQYFAAAARAGADDLPQHVEYILQADPAGFGDAVARGADFIGRDDGFLVMLGDHVQIAEPGQPACAAQVADAFARHGGAAMIGVQTVGPDELPRVGTARGEPLADRVYRCTRFVEKPTPAEADRDLVTPHLPKNRYLAHCGIYGFTPEIFACLAEVARAGSQPGHEVQLADAQSLLLERHSRDYHQLHLAGRAYDTGTPAGYARTFAAVRKLMWP